jgi:hypothetical protein
MTIEQEVAELRQLVETQQEQIAELQARPIAPSAFGTPWSRHNPLANKSLAGQFGQLDGNRIKLVGVKNGGPAIQVQTSADNVPIYIRPQGLSAVILADLTGQHVIIGDSLSPTGKVRMPIDEFISWEGGTPGTGIDAIRVEDKAGRDTLILGSTGCDDTWVSAITAVFLNAPTLGFYGVSGTTRPTISGAKGGNAALGSLLTALAAFGLITDGTSA